MSTNKKSKSADFVVIRAFADEPVRLKFVRVRGMAIDATGKDEKSPMPFHLTRAYHFQPDLYDKMRTAYESSDRDRLNKLWNEASPFKPAA